MTWVAVGVGGASLVGSFMSSRSSKRASQQQAAAQAQALAVQREELNFARARDARSQAIVDENNQYARSRRSRSEAFFDQLTRSVQEMDPERGLAPALSEVEGTMGVRRRSLRSDIGGGLSRTKTGALNLASNRIRAQLRNQITSSNLDKRLALLSTMSAPVSLQTPESLTSGGATGAMSNILSNQASMFAHSAQQSAATAAHGASSAFQLLGRGVSQYQDLQTARNMGYNSSLGVTPQNYVAMNNDMSTLFGER